MPLLNGLRTLFKVRESQADRIERKLDMLLDAIVQAEQDQHADTKPMQTLDGDTVRKIAKREYGGHL